MILRHFDVAHGASSVFQNSVQIGLSFAIGRERVVMAVEEQRGSGGEAGMHGRGFFGVELDDGEALPGRTIANGGVWCLEDARSLDSVTMIRKSESS